MDLKTKLISRVRRKKWKYINNGLFYQDKFVVDLDEVIETINKTFKEK